MPFLLAAAFAVAVQDTAARPVVRAARTTSAIDIDGRLDEPVWRTAEPVTRFVQSSPVEGAAATERAEVRFVVDGGALYVAARLFDRAPDSVMALLTRRDRGGQSDFVTVHLDPLGDRRTGYEFTVSAAGVQSDATLYNDDWSDASWDGVWQSAVRRDGEGWSAELRIPLSQLRMTEGARRRWGVNVSRGIGRRNEVSSLVPRQQQGSGFVSRFADLDGLDGLAPRRRAELLPYVTGRAEFSPAAPGDPFRDGSRTLPGAGADFRLGLGRGFQLDGTINPDFGQVEVDPAVVNLSDVEVFFEERRPFFVEGINVFRFGFGGANNFMGFNWVNLDPFYSRRIGRAPAGALPSSEHRDVPSGVHILGATKLTGRAGAWNVGLLGALTRREHARYAVGGDEFRAEVEPLATYGVARLQRDFAGGRHGFGVLGTLTRRDFKDDRLRDQLDASAQVAGLDGWVTLDRARRWVLSGWGAVSRVTGTATRITALQTGATHYFQRPDADHVDVDPAATSLVGSYGRLSLNKQQGSVLFNAALGMVSPGFDNNDLGFVGRTDVINGHVSSGYRWTRPSSWYQSARIQGTVFASWDFAGTRTSTGLWGSGRVTWKNFSSTSLGFSASPPTTSVRATRGGPAMASPAGAEVFGGWSSDGRKPLQLSVDGSAWNFTDADAISRRLSIGLTWRPATNVTLSAGPSIDLVRNATQYLRASTDPSATGTYGRRYLFGDLEQRTLSANVRANWIFSPRMSLELFAQPLISSGRYLAVRELERAGTRDFLTYGTRGSTIDRAAGTADPDGAGPAPAITIGQPDFTVASLRGNAVFRWEYSPGSTLFLVWTQSRALQEADGEFAPRRAFDRLLDAPGSDVLMMKVSYWLSR